MYFRIYSLLNYLMHRCFGFWTYYAAFCNACRIVCCIFFYVIMHVYAQSSCQDVITTKKLLGCLSHPFLVSHHNLFVATTTEHFSVAIVYHHGSILWCDNHLLWNKPKHHLIIVTVPFGAYCYGKKCCIISSLL